MEESVDPVGATHLDLRVDVVATGAKLPVELGFMRQCGFLEADDQRLAQQNLRPNVGNAGRCRRSCAALVTGR